MKETLEVPAGFSEKTELYIAAVQKQHEETGTVSQESLDWLFRATRNADILLHATAKFANVANETVEFLNGEIEEMEGLLFAANEEIADLKGQLADLTPEEA